MHQHCVVFPEGINDLEEFIASLRQAGATKDGIEKMLEVLGALTGKQGPWCDNAVATPWHGKKMPDIMAHFAQMEEHGWTVETWIYVADNAKLKCGINSLDGLPDIVAAAAANASKDLQRCITMWYLPKKLHVPEPLQQSLSIFGKATAAVSSASGGDYEKWLRVCGVKLRAEEERLNKGRPRAREDLLSCKAKEVDLPTKEDFRALKGGHKVVKLWLALNNAVIIGVVQREHIYSKARLSARITRQRTGDAAVVGASQGATQPAVPGVPAVSAAVALPEAVAMSQGAMQPAVPGVPAVLAPGAPLSPGNTFPSYLLLTPPTPLVPAVAALFALAAGTPLSEGEKAMLPQYTKLVEGAVKSLAAELAAANEAFATGNAAAQPATGGHTGYPRP
ncbi:hypothetical protein FOA52_002455 [Chlamydomonas sp. UWO 241]|nr:hypothetical protein FOA52_002455 [Chlamydomonas sp. UWO 241]